MKTHWVQQAAQLEKAATNFVMVSVVSIQGSTPREIGARMLITKDAIFNTIGGGHLEWKAMAYARQCLENRQPINEIKEYPLGATLGQCCGGKVSLLFESVFQADFSLAIFGAGHVGKAIIHCLGQIPCKVYWIDSRANEFPQECPENIIKIHSDYPVDEIKDLPSNSYYLVLTHNHQLDLDLSEAILKHNDFAYLGVIGSKTKSARFKHKLRDKGFSSEAIARMECPMGEPEIVSKQPGEIAVSTLSQLLKYRQKQTPTKQEKRSKEVLYENSN
ncbi:xanthine dehydrogenase accessory protein XdhC [Marinomonas algicola]|uniref:xanthine dehydrogenase accessory protein XdhC n=1 Tax=Marinomonas algicola TaxID=2773454 RepID=UPI00174BCE28|nr:xanthine dehydrogenase accessory protein XdhC [Marinomonas algicola]